MKNIFITLLIFLGMASASFAESVVIIEVEDAVTFKLDNGKRLRLLGVDTYGIEANKKSKHRAKRMKIPLEEYLEKGKKSYEFVEGHMKDKKVMLEYDVERVDKYNRLIAYVWFETDDPELLVSDNGYWELRENDESEIGAYVMLNATMLKSGYANFQKMGNNKKYNKSFAKYALDAKKAKRGIWK